MLRMVENKFPDDAPKEVWLEYSVEQDGSNPNMEYDHLEPQPNNCQAIKYVRADLIKES